MHLKCKPLEVCWRYLTQGVSELQSLFEYSENVTNEFSTATYLATLAVHSKKCHFHLNLVLGFVFFCSVLTSRRLSLLTIVRKFSCKRHLSWNSIVHYFSFCVTRLTKNFRSELISVNFHPIKFTGYAPRVPMGDALYSWRNVLFSAKGSKMINF